MSNDTTTPTEPRKHFIRSPCVGGMWWRPRGGGYTNDVREAGLFTAEEAGRKIAGGRLHRCGCRCRPGVPADEMVDAIDELATFSADALGVSDG